MSSSLKIPIAVDQGIGTLGFLHGIGEGAAAGVIDAIGDHQQDLLILGAFLQVIEGANHGVVEGGAAAGVDALEGVFHFGDVVGEIVNRVQIEVVVEIDDEGFVLRIAGLYQGQSGGVHLGTLVSHAAAIVDHQAHAHGHVFLAEHRNFLFDFVFQHAELVLLKSRDELAAIIDHGNVQDDEVDVLADGVVGRRLGRRLGRGWLCRTLRAQRGSQRKSQRRSRQNQRERRELIDRARSIPSWRRH